MLLKRKHNLLQQQSADERELLRQLRLARGPDAYRLLRYIQGGSDAKSVLQSISRDPELRHVSQVTASGSRAVSYNDTRLGLSLMEAADPSTEMTLPSFSALLYRIPLYNSPLSSLILSIAVQRVIYHQQVLYPSSYCGKYRALGVLAYR